MNTSPCAAWSNHAASLADTLTGQLEHFDEVPSTQVLVRDGVLVRLLPGVFFPGHLELSRVDRALVIGCGLGTRLRAEHVIAGATACWVHTGGPLPQPVHLHTETHRMVLGGVQVLRGPLDIAEIEQVGGAPVTTPLRTAVDLLHLQRSGTALWCLSRLLRHGLVDLTTLEDRVRTGPPRARHRVARTRLQVLRAREGARSQPASAPSRASTGVPSAVTR